MTEKDIYSLERIIKLQRSQNKILTRLLEQR